MNARSQLAQLATRSKISGGDLAPGVGLDILITASRSWTDETRMYQALTICALHVDYAFRHTETFWPVASTNPDRVRNFRGRMMSIMEGDAPGGDRMAGRWAIAAATLGWPIKRPERRPAEWHAPCRPECRPGHRRPTNDREGKPDGDVCPRAGFYRNEEMVKEIAERSKPVIVLAFIHNKSNGATNCLDAAIKAGLPWVLFEQE